MLLDAFDFFPCPTKKWRVLSPATTNTQIHSPCVDPQHNLIFLNFSFVFFCLFVVVFLRGGGLTSITCTSIWSGEYHGYEDHLKKIDPDYNFSELKSVHLKIFRKMILKYPRINIPGFILLKYYYYIFVTFIILSA